MQSLSKIKTIPGFAEPLNVTFLPDGSKAYVGNYGAHWVGVVDVRRHELVKKIPIAEVPGVAKLDPEKYLGEIHGINIAMLVIEFRSADGKLVDVGEVKGGASMSMSGTPMLGSIDVRRGDQAGQYIADTQLDMAGTWRLTLEWKGPAGSGATSFSGNVQ